MSTREATTDDIDAIRAVARAAWETDYPAILSRETVEEGIEEWYAPDRLYEEFADVRTRVFVAVEEDADGREVVVGFSHAIVGSDETGLGDDGDGHLLRLYVHPDHRERGVGRQLLERTRDALFERGVERIKAMVLAENDLGNAFYRGFGFEKVAESETTVGGETYRENTYELPRSTDDG